MSTNLKKVNIYLKKFLPQQQITENFLDYLQQLTLEAFATVYQSNGVFIPDVNTTQLYSFTAPNSFNLVTQLKGTDGPQGHILNLDALDAFQIPFENSLGIVYHIGQRYAEIPDSSEINVRTGAIKYTYFKEAIGELADPTSVVDDGDETLTVDVSSVFEPGVSNAGRQVVLWLKDPVSQADTFEECTVLWDGVKNYVLTQTALGQTIGNVSVDESMYTVFARGVTVRRNTDLSLDPDIMYLGTVTGAGLGNTPSVYDQSGVQNLSYGLSGIIDLFAEEHSLSDGSHTDITADTITTKQSVGGVQLTIQAKNTDEDIPDADFAFTKVKSAGGTGIQQYKDVLKDSAGNIIAAVDAHGNIYAQRIIANEIYMGDPNTNDKFRWVFVAGKMQLQVLRLGVWTKKESYDPTDS